MLGSFGGFLGLIIGNFFDRGLMQHFSDPFLIYHQDKNLKRKKIFFETIFMSLGLMAKADGRVSSESIAYTQDLMSAMKLNTKQMLNAREYFNRGKSSSHELSSLMSKAYLGFQGRPALSHLFIDTLYNFLKKTGLSEKKMQIMNQILNHFRLAPLVNHPRFLNDFPWYRFQQQQYYYKNSGGQSQSYQQQKRSTQSFDDPYQILEISSSVSQAELKRAYRRLVSLNHPDKLIAKGATASQIKAATEKTQKICQAYEAICRSKGW